MDTEADTEPKPEKSIEPVIDAAEAASSEEPPAETSSPQDPAVAAAEPAPAAEDPAPVMETEMDTSPNGTKEQESPAPAVAAATAEAAPRASGTTEQSAAPVKTAVTAVTLAAKAPAAKIGFAKASEGDAGDDRRGGSGSGRRRSGPRDRPGGAPGHRERDALNPDEGPELVEKVVFINRCAKVVKGGRRFSFSALVVSGNREGKVGFGFGKANEVSESIRKASDASRKNMIEVAVQENTIPHEVIGEFGGGRVLLRPASPGTGIIAGGGVRAVMEAAGIKDVLGKSMGSKNHANVVKATLSALQSLRKREEIYQLRGKKTVARKAL